MLTRLFLELKCSFSSSVDVKLELEPSPKQKKKGKQERKEEVKSMWISKSLFHSSNEGSKMVLEGIITLLFPYIIYTF